MTDDTKRRQAHLHWSVRAVTRRGCVFTSLLILAVCMLPAGCGPKEAKRVPVSGQVVIDGKPLTHGIVRFVPEGSRASMGTLDEQGRFTLTCFDGSKGAVLATHGVEVAAAESLSETAVRWHAPKKYANLQSSGLTVEITEPTDDLVIELSWAGGRPFVERK